MSYYKPESINSFWTGFAKFASLGGFGFGLYNAYNAVAATGLTLASLGTGGLGSGLLLAATSLAGMVCAHRTEQAREENEQSLAALHTFQRTGARPAPQPSIARDTNKQPSPFTTGLAGFGGLWFAIAGVLGMIAGGGATTALLEGGAIALLGVSLFKVASVASDARHYADSEQKAAIKEKLAAAGKLAKAPQPDYASHPANDRPKGFSHVQRLNAQRAQQPAWQHRQP